MVTGSVGGNYSRSNTSRQSSIRASSVSPRQAKITSFDMIDSKNKVEFDDSVSDSQVSEIEYGW